MNKYSEERKQLQEQGLIPNWWTTQGYQLFKEKYQWANNPRGQYEAIARTAAQWLTFTKWEEQAYDKFFNLLWNGWLSPSTPILANMGTDRGLPISCSGGYISDSIDGFYTSRRETAILTKYGFGTSGYLGDIRSRGSNISIGGRASGVLPVFKGFVRDMQEVSQGSTRRGAWAGYLPINHSDFDELCDLLHSSDDDLNIGWIVSEKDIQSLDSGDPEMLRRYQKVLKVKMITGKGYFFFVDKASDFRPDCYKERGLDIKASNLCVAPETKILTSEGYFSISELHGRLVHVWNGMEFSEIRIIKTGTNQKLLKVVTDSGFELECTEYHKWYITDGEDIKEVRTNELVKGDKLIKFDLPIIHGWKELKQAWVNGFYTGDGCSYKGKQIIYLYGDKKSLLPELPNIKWNSYQEDQDRYVGFATKLKDKYFVPSADYTVKSRLDWLAGYLDADGCIYSNGETQQITCASVNLEFLKELQLMLQTLGVHSKIKTLNEEGYRNLPTHNGDEYKDYNCKKSYRLMLAPIDSQNLLTIGLNLKRLKIEKRMPNRDARRFVLIEDIIDAGRYDDTYCFTEPKRHMGVFNGILTGQCTEIMLHSSEDYTFTCVLSSMNLAKYDEWKDTDAVFWATAFLDCVVEEFLHKAKGIPGLERAVNFTEKGRALGLGVCGLHTLLQQRGIAFDSLDAQFLNTKIFKKLGIETDIASNELAMELGYPEWCDYRRNTHTMAIAPTKSTALIMGGVSEGINPDPAMVYTQATAAGEVERVNPVLLNLMKERGVYNEETINRIAENYGSVQNETWLTDDERRVFKTAFEIDQRVVLRLASQRQQYIDQGQSINLFFSSESDEQYISEVHKQAFKDPNILSLYYVYSTKQAISSSECESCQ